MSVTGIIARVLEEATGTHCEICDTSLPFGGHDLAETIIGVLDVSGYAIVPIEPTEAMKLVGVETECGLGPYALPDVIAASYRAMISSGKAVR